MDQPIKGDPVLDQLADGLLWVDLVSGQFFAKNEQRFQRNGRADALLLSNLSYIRRELTRDLPEAIAHDLLARLIFIQFLFQRKDSTGRPALHKGILRSLHRQGKLSQPYSVLSQILKSKEDTYALFEWLDGRFNGDLFPDDWAEEKEKVNSTHLNLLADFVSGDLRMDDGQLCLWPLYSFDAIPLEFISSIYEEFVSPSDEGGGIGEHYTPPELVDLVLDKVLPWNGTDYDIKVLDPACGSAVFLVKVFQRLVHRWRIAFPEREPSASFLRGLLERNLFGVDINPRAIRVASFSLYLAMCDEKDPRHYWKTIRFPSLRGISLRTEDFFTEDVVGIRTHEDSGRYDLIVGNAPWGKQSLTPKAQKWADTNGWETADKQGGILFLPKSAALTKPSGLISMIQSANAMLFNRNSTSIQLRKKLFETFTVYDVVNLSTLRFDIFSDAVAPVCIVTMSPSRPSGKPIAYWCPKKALLNIVIDAHDLNWVYPDEAASVPWVWTALLWGTRRDLELLQRLHTSSKTLEGEIKKGTWGSVRGFERGMALPKNVLSAGNARVFIKIARQDRLNKVQFLLLETLSSNPESARVLVVCYPEHVSAIESLPAEHKGRIRGVALLGDKGLPKQKLPECDIVIILSPLSEHRDRYMLPALEDHEHWNRCPRVVSADDFPPNKQTLFGRARELESYHLPLLLMKQSWVVDSARFRGIVVQPGDQHDRLLFSQSFYGIRAPNDNELASLAVAINSILIVYYFYLSSGRLAAYRPTVRKMELDDIPLPPHVGATLDQLAVWSQEEIDEQAFALFGLNDVERCLVREFFEITLKDFKADNKTASPGRQAVRSPPHHSYHDLQLYCESLIRVIRAGFGEEKPVCSTIFKPEQGYSPYCVVAIHLEWQGQPLFTTRELASVSFQEILQRLNGHELKRDRTAGSIFYRRVAKIYRVLQLDDPVTGQANTVPTVYIVKPNERRYWTRSAALRDGDDVASDLFIWGSQFHDGLGVPDE